jgi:endonuclease/exonuclease/phosphatase family metal-dependent hydrolase
VAVSLRAATLAAGVFRVADWNIERGTHLPAILEFLKKCKADLIFLQEVDLNARRTRHLDVAREIAQSLQLNFVFGKEFEELTKVEMLSRQALLRGLNFLAPDPSLCL